jgi:predicted DNA-binding transcriptional regulator AlpA
MTPCKPSGHPEMPSQTPRVIVQSICLGIAPGLKHNSLGDQERSEMATVDSVLETLLNEHDVARITGLSVASVRRWRLLRQGPKYIKIGAAVRYKPEDVSAWLETRPSGGGQQA